MFEQFAIRCCKYLVNQAIENCRRLLLFDEGACIEIYPTPLKFIQSAIGRDLHCWYKATERSPSARRKKYHLTTAQREC